MLNAAFIQSRYLLTQSMTSPT